ncbi:MAG TPA: FIST N-terminal domain-containing protein [Sporichthyaceae bacterium]|jgi:small ligand-binding sensory domain FIST
MRFGSAVARVAPGRAEQSDPPELAEAVLGVPATVLQSGDLAAAATAAAGAALAALDGAVPDLACVFISGYDPVEIAAAGTAAANILGAEAMIGCSAPGVIGLEVGLELQPAVSVWAAVLPGAELRTFHLSVLRGDESLTVLGLPDAAAEHSVAVLLADPRTFPIDGFVELSNEVLPGLPLVGGLATGALRGGSTWLCRDGQSFDGGAVGVLIGGDIAVATVVSQGCRPIGPTMIVTKSEGNELLELAGKPATEKLQDIITELDPEERQLALTGLQIGIAMDEYAETHERGDFLIRGVAGLYPDHGSVVVGDVVDIGRTVRFQVRDAAAAHDELGAVLTKFRDVAGAPGGALLFSCNGRGASMFASADHDPLMVAEGLGVGAVAGFFAGGEIGPVGGRNHLHGFTASILTFGGEEPSA